MLISLLVIPIIGILLTSVTMSFNDKEKNIKLKVYYTIYIYIVKVLKKFFL